MMCGCQCSVGPSHRSASGRGVLEHPVRPESFEVRHHSLALDSIPGGLGKRLKSGQVTKWIRAITSLNRHEKNKAQTVREFERRVTDSRWLLFAELLEHA